MESLSKIGSPSLYNLENWLETLKISASKLTKTASFESTSKGLVEFSSLKLLRK